MNVLISDFTMIGAAIQKCIITSIIDTFGDQHSAPLHTTVVPIYYICIFITASSYS